MNGTAFLESVLPGLAGRNSCYGELAVATSGSLVRLLLVVLVLVVVLRWSDSFSCLGFTEGPETPLGIPTAF
eukprot:1006272-Rhodomonas_salina.1